ncbi:MAG TPA: hypothetical protein VHV77_07040, partial [Pirellulales bacterium]|nr:hypothetical protein [Pirellulales bacterium]
MQARRFCTVFLATMSVGCLAWVAAATAKEPDEPKFDKARIEALRKQYPYLSLADRLRYEQRLRDATPPLLSRDADATL